MAPRRLATRCASPALSPTTGDTAVVVSPTSWRATNYAPSSPTRRPRRCASSLLVERRPPLAVTLPLRLRPAASHAIRRGAAADTRKGAACPSQTGRGEQRGVLSPPAGVPL